MSRGAFDEKGGGAPPLSPGVETLQQSSEHDDQWCRDADCSVV
jgi:hypothetical protein